MPALLPHVMAVNVRALAQRQPASQSLGRYDEVARLLTGSATATAIDGVVWMEQLCEQLQVPGLGHYGLTESDFANLIAKAKRTSSMQGNPIQLQADELGEVLSRAL